MIFNGLNCNAAQYIIPGTFGVREFIFDVNLMIWPISDLQIKMAAKFSSQLYFVWK